MRRARCETMKQSSPMAGSTPSPPTSSAERVAMRVAAVGAIAAMLCGAGVSRQDRADGGADRGRGGISQDVARREEGSMRKNWLPTRRAVVAGAGAAGALGAVPLLLVRPAAATPEKMQAAIKSVIGEATVKKGKVTLDIPPLVENGNTVAMSVTVESPMTEADH